MKTEYFSLDVAFDRPDYPSCEASGPNEYWHLMHRKDLVMANDYDAFRAWYEATNGPARCTKDIKTHP